MKSGAVIEGFDVIEDRSTSLGEAVEAMMVEKRALMGRLQGPL